MCTMNWGHMLWTLIDAPTLFVSRALSETRTTRDLRHPATTNTRYYSQTRYLQRNTTSPLLHSTSAPRTSRLPHKPKPQVLLLRFPPPLRSRGALLLYHVASHLELSRRTKLATAHFFNVPHIAVAQHRSVCNSTYSHAPSATYCHTL
jgi:hypothetical protein